MEGGGVASDDAPFDDDIEEMMKNLDETTIKKYQERLGQLAAWLHKEAPALVLADGSIDFGALSLNLYFRFLKHRLEDDLVSYDVLRVRNG